MQLIISVLILFILINCVLKLSFWRIWQAALFGAVCGAFVIATYPYAILQSKTQLADYLQNTTALQNMAVIITLESVVCFAYCIAVLLAWLGDLSLKDASTVGGVLIGVLMLAINWYYKHQSFKLLRGGKISRGEYESFNR